MDSKLIPQTIRNQTVFIPVSYLVYDNGQPREKYREHINADPPTIRFKEFDDHGRILNKWQLEFDSVDSDGYDAQTFQYYFNSLDEVITFLREQNV